MRKTHKPYSNDEKYRKLTQIMYYEKEKKNTFQVYIFTTGPIWGDGDGGCVVEFFLDSLLFENSYNKLKHAIIIKLFNSCIKKVKRCKGSNKT